MKWFCWRLPKKSSISLSLLQEREGTVENRSKAIVLPFLFSDENRMMQSQRDNESIMEWNVLSSCTWFRDLHGSLSNLPLVRLHRYFFCWPQKVPCNRPHVMPPGYDNIDLKACEAKSVVAMNTPGQNANAVAELVFGWFLVQYVQYWSVLFNHSLGSWHGKCVSWLQNLVFRQNLLQTLPSIPQDDCQCSQQLRWHQWFRVGQPRDRFLRFRRSGAGGA